MLVLSRKVGEKLQIGNDIILSIVSLEGGQVKIGIDAPKEVKIYRKEVLEEAVEINQKSREVTQENLQQIISLMGLKNK